MKQAVTDGIRLEVRRAYFEVDASRQQVEVARSAIAQAQESLRIHQDRYDSGLVTITDLLGAEEANRRDFHSFIVDPRTFHRLRGPEPVSVGVYQLVSDDDVSA